VQLSTYVQNKSFSIKKAYIFANCFFSFFLIDENGLKLNFFFAEKDSPKKLNQIIFVC
jgi:hypothetical protein